TKAMLTILADDKTREYGDANPTFPGSVSGQLFPYTTLFRSSTSAVATSAVGAYAIVPAVTGATLGNYVVHATDGSLTVTKATLTILADDKSREYGDANPTFTGSVSGQKNSEAFPETFSTSAVAASAVGA